MYGWVNDGAVIGWSWCGIEVRWKPSGGNSRINLELLLACKVDRAFEEMEWSSVGGGIWVYAMVEEVGLGLW